VVGRLREDLDRLLAENAAYRREIAQLTNAHQREIEQSTTVIAELRETNTSQRNDLEAARLREVASRERETLIELVRGSQQMPSKSL
jgi:hypothetical protein